jgi:hypothetical protein
LTPQPCHGLCLAVGGNPPLDYLVDGILGRLAHLSFCVYCEETDNLELLAGGDDGEVFHILEHSLSCVKHFKFFSAMGAGATAYALRKRMFAFPSVSALGASEDAAFRSVGIVLEAMLKCVCRLLLGQLG